LQNTQQLLPIAVKESVASKTELLIQEGYVRVEEAIACPLCGERFLLMLDPRDHSRHQTRVKDGKDAFAFFQQLIMQDHINDHPHWQFRMTGAS
jgi:hypothetical protein